MKLIQQGAEAKILLKKINSPKQKFSGKLIVKKPEVSYMIIKDRISKPYRILELDKKIRKSRTKAEKKLLEKASKIIKAPDPFPLKEWNIIKMPFIDGKKLSEDLDNFPLTKQKQICKQIGESIAKLHTHNIIHGDLTTSNMILVSDNSLITTSDLKNLGLKKSQQRSLTKSVSKSSIGEPEASVFFIDFGLGFISHRIEDKAVDLHLLKQALEAKHFKNWEILFKEIERGYKKSKDTKSVLERLKAVEKRGRYKH